MSRSQPVTVETDYGAVVCERCAVAESPVSRLRGLLGRKSLPVGEGLLLGPSSSVHTCFMRFPIDVVFLAKDGEVLKVVPEMRSWRIAAARRAKRVLELPAGECERRALRPGAVLSWGPAEDRRPEQAAAA